MKKRIAEVAIPISIAVDEAFDYLIPGSLDPPIDVGCRVLVPFRTSLVRGYVVKLKNHSYFESKLKPIIKNLDSAPVLDKSLFRLAKKIQDDYFCSFADALQTVIPSGLKKTMKTAGCDKDRLSGQNIPIYELSEEESHLLEKKEIQAKNLLIHDLSDKKRWQAYSALIKKTLNLKKSVIFLVPDHAKIDPSLKRLNLNIEPYKITSGIKTGASIDAWMAIKMGDFSFVIGTRSAIFSPVNNLGLIIIEEEEHFAYRADQVPNYRAHKIASWLTSCSDARLVLGSFAPSLDSYYLYKKEEAGYIKFERVQDWAQIKLIDMSQDFSFKRKIISKILEYRLSQALEKKGKILIFAHKKGFSTFLYCAKCKKTLNCQRCSSSLIYHFKDKILSCPSCRYKTKSFDICPECRSSYIKYSGFGTEKVESEILRLFPTAKIIHYEKQKTALFDPSAQILSNGVKKETGYMPEGLHYDIMLATQQFLEDPKVDEYSFDSIFVLSCEQMLSHADFRSSEKAFSRLLKLSSLAKNETCLQSSITDNYALGFLIQHDTDGFFEYELKLREELELPPVTQMAVLTVRSPEKDSALEACGDYLKKFKKIQKNKKSLKIFNPIPAMPFRVRGNYRYQIPIKYRRLDTVRKILKSILKKRKRGVIVTFDPTPY